MNVLAIYVGYTPKRLDIAIKIGHQLNCDTNLRQFWNTQKFPSLFFKGSPNQVILALIAFQGLLDTNEWGLL